VEGARSTQQRLAELLRSPSTGKDLEWRHDELRTAAGDERFPVVAGIPVLIDERSSVFTTDTFLTQPPGPARTRARLRTLARSLLPSISHNLAANRNFERLLIELENDQVQAPLVLVIGGASPGNGVEALIQTPSVTLIETDVAFGPRTQVICDAHALPFADGVFDAVVCQAVLEHVVDAPTVVGEIHRVLAPRGFVYSEIPFLQQVHEGAYDFTRYTLIGHRLLYRHFVCIDSGVTAGPGTALAWALKHTLLPLAGRSAPRRSLLTALSNVLFFWLKYLDYLLLRAPSASDAASGTYLLGRRVETPYSDRDLLDSFGAERSGFRIARG
jgi:SAM-dependent methyltransferase